MAITRINNTEFRRKSLPDRTQYLKDCDDDMTNNFRGLSTKLKTIIGILSGMFVMIGAYLFDLIFIH